MKTRRITKSERQQMNRAKGLKGSARIARPELKRTEAQISEIKKAAKP